MRTHHRQSGFALLLVFLMAAVIAITLYIEIPRVAFEAQRQKEQLLIERGEQYTRAIQLFVRANRRYPARLEDLEKYNDRHFLRHRFFDPMTAQDQWRLIHINPLGGFSDSLVYQPKAIGQGQEAAPAQQEEAEPMAVARRRPSEGGTGLDGQLVTANVNIQTAGLAGPYPGQPNLSGQEAQSPPLQLNFGGQSNPGASSSQAVIPGSAGPQAVTAGQAYVGNNQPYVGGSRQYVGGQTGSPGVSGSGIGPSGFGSQLSSGQGNLTGSASQFQPAGFINGPGTNPVTQPAQNSAITQQTSTGMPVYPANTAIAAGIAGVASTAGNSSIMIYHHRTKYNEWEFIFDITRQKPLIPGMDLLDLPSSARSVPGTSGSPGMNGTPNVGLPGMAWPNPQPSGAAPGPPADMRAGQR